MQLQSGEIAEKSKMSVCDWIEQTAGNYGEKE